MNNTSLAIRDAGRDDIGFLAECNLAMAIETERRTLDRALLTRGIEAVFADPARGFYLVAEQAGSAVASLLVTREWSDWRCGDWWWLQSVYVVPSSRRSGVFRALYAEVERRALAAAQVVGLRLYVERANARAQATYAALDMRASHYQLFERGFGETNGVGAALE